MPAEHAPRAAVLFALREEAAPFLRRLVIPKTVPLDARRITRACGALRDRAVCIACSGAGERNAEEGIRLLSQAQDSPFSCLLICGFAGGLAAEMAPGSLLVAERVTVHGDKASPEVYPADSRLLALANSVGLPGIDLRRGALHTTNRILISPAEKKALAERTGAQAADMDGNVDRSRVILAVLTHPWKIPALIRLGTNSACAARNLASFVEAFLGLLPD